MVSTLCGAQAAATSVPAFPQQGQGWEEGALGRGRLSGSPDLTYALPRQPSQLFTLGPSEHSPLKTPYFDAGISIAEQIGTQVRGRLGSRAQFKGPGSVSDMRSRTEGHHSSSELCLWPEIRALRCV